MKTAVFVDTGFWIALFDKRDLNHSIAKDNLKPLLQNYRLYLYAGFDDHFRQVGFVSVMDQLYQGS